MTAWTRLTETDLLTCVRFLPGNLRDLLMAHPNRMYVAGGYVRSTIAREKVHDIDIMLHRETPSYTAALELADKDADALHITANATTVASMNPSVQFITRWLFASPQDVLKSFDFTIAAAIFWYDGSGWTSLCHPDYYTDLAARRLVYMKPVREEEPGGSMLRVLKFTERGYRIGLGDLAAVIARLTDKVHGSEFSQTEEGYIQVIQGLLYEVDPAADPHRSRHRLSTVKATPS